jgi:hypothetical protein
MACQFTKRPRCAIYLGRCAHENRLPNSRRAVEVSRTGFFAGNKTKDQLVICRIPAAEWAGAGIDVFFFPLIVIRSKRRRFTKAAARAFVFPGINDQIIFFKMVMCTSKTVSIAVGAIADFLTFTGHLFAKKRASWNVPMTYSRSLFYSNRENRGQVVPL